MKIDFTKTATTKGLRVVVSPMKEAGTVTFLVMVGTGSKYEPAEWAGISHFLEHLFFKGTKKRPSALEISEFLDEVGGEFNAFTSKEFTGYYAKVAVRHAERAYDVISDILLNSKFETAEIDRERGVIIEEMRMYQDMPMRYVDELFEDLLYPGQAAGRLVVGTEETVRSLKRDDFVKYLAEHYVAKNMIVGVSGELSLEEGQAQAEKYFSEAATGDPKGKEEVDDSQRVVGVDLHQKKTDQTHLVLGVRGFDIFDERRWPLRLLAIILGGGMSSRLFMSVRERLGLAYYIRCGIEEYTDSGYLMAKAGVDNTKVVKAVAAIMDEFKKILAEGVPEKELTKAKEFLKGKTLMSLETSDDVVMWLLNQEVLRGKIETLEDKFGKIDAVTTKEVAEIAGEVFRPDKLNLAMISPFGDQTQLEEQLKF